MGGRTATNHGGGTQVRGNPKRGRVGTTGDVGGGGEAKSREAEERG